MLVGRFIPGTKLLPLKLLSFYARAFYGSWAGHKLRNGAVHGGAQARSRTRYAGRVRLHAPAAHRTVAPEHTGGTHAGTRRRHPIRKDQR